MPDDPGYRNDAFLTLYADRQAGRTFLEQTPIACKAAGSSSIYVSAEGLVFPCCWTASLYPLQSAAESEEIRRLGEQLAARADPVHSKELVRLRPKGLPETWSLIERLPEGKDSINAKRIPIREILEGPFFRDQIPAGWETKPFVEGRLSVCAKHCGLKNVKSSQNVKVSLGEESAPRGSVGPDSKSLQRHQVPSRPQRRSEPTQTSGSS